MKFFGTWSIFYPACLKGNLRPNWKRRLGTISYAVSQLLAWLVKETLVSWSLSISLSVSPYFSLFQEAYFLHLCYRSTTLTHKVSKDCRAYP